MPEGAFCRGRPRAPAGHAIFSRRQGVLRVALQSEVSDEDVRGIVRKIIELALIGDLGAARIFFEWVVGELPPPVHPDRLDEDEMSVQQAAPTPLDQAFMELDQAPAQDAEAIWTEFAETRLEWGSPWAAPVAFVYATYVEWCHERGVQPLSEADILAWLGERGAMVGGATGERWMKGLRVSE
jgi:hypothetical protein